MTEIKVPSVNVILRATEAQDSAFAVGQAFIRPNPDDDIYRRIGLIASEWAHLEHMLDRIIWELADVAPQKGACITGQMMGVWPRINSIEALLICRAKQTKTLTDFIKPLRKFGKDCRNPSNRRNRFIHDPWYVEVNSDQYAQHKSMPKDEWAFGLTDIPEGEVKSLLDDIKALSERAATFKREISSALSTSR